jgi:hypothetical protein
VRRDVKTVFHNTAEFAEKTEIAYNGRTYNIDAMLDYTGTEYRKAPSGDHAEGVFLADAKLYIPESDINPPPRPGRNIKVGKKDFRIVKTGIEMGEIVLDLEEFTE